MKRYLVLRPTRIDFKNSKVYGYPPWRAHRVDCYEALERFCKIRNQADIERFVRRFGMPLAVNPEFADGPRSQIISFFLDMAFTLSWVSCLIDWLACMQEDTSFRPNELVAEEASPPDILTRYLRWIKRPDAVSKLDELFPGREYSLKAFARRLQDTSNPIISRILSLIPPVVNGTVLKPSASFLRRFPPDVKLVSSDEVNCDWALFAIPELPEYRNRPQFYIEETLRAYFSNEEGLVLLRVNSEVVLNLKSGDRPVLELRMNTLLDGMIHALLSKWQETKFRRCLNCPTMFTFKRASKKFCKEACEKAYGRRNR